MKKITLFCIAALVAITSSAQSEKFVAAMKKNLGVMDSSFRNTTDLIKMSNNFERIALAEKTQWLPYYYAALCQVNAGFMEQDKSKVDAIADKATELINKADSIAPNNSEISCIKSMIASCHMLVNPMERWMQYGEASNNYIETAIQQDPTNPRPYFLRGQTLKNTPEQFGGGCGVAKPVLQTALSKYTSFKTAGELHPNWGKEQVEGSIKDCK